MKDFVKSVMEDKGITDKATVEAVFTLLRGQMKNQLKEYKKIMDTVKSEPDFTEEEKAMLTDFDKNLDNTVESAEKVLELFEKKVLDILED